MYSLPIFLVVLYVDVFLKTYLVHIFLWLYFIGWINKSRVSSQLYIHIFGKLFDQVKFSQIYYVSGPWKC